MNRQLKRFGCMLPILLVMSMCSNSGSPETSAPKPQRTLLPFTPPADSSLTQAQILAWFQCNTLLDSLSSSYRDSFVSADPDLLYRAQNTFSVAQDTLCRSAGLAGGHQHYLWITRALALPANAHLRDTFKIVLP